MSITAVLNQGEEITASFKPAAKIKVEMGGGGGGFGMLRTLSDVDATDMTEGNIVVYDIDSDTFITRRNPKHLTLDCGTF